MTSELVKRLANEMGVSEADVLCFARSIANSITKDRSADFFVSTSEQNQCDMVSAYATHAVRKMNEFYTSYITSSEVSNLFNDMVFAGLSGVNIEGIK